MSNENDQASSITQDLPKILSGELPEYIVTHPGHSQYSNAGGGVSACGVAALNSARLVLGLHAAGIDSAQLVQELTERSFLEDILRPCLSWSISSHLAVDEIHKAPAFDHTLKLVSSYFGQASYGFLKRLLDRTAEVTQKRQTSACVIITRPPEIVACFSIVDAPSPLFVIFDSHPRPNKHPDGAAFIFHHSSTSVARYLAELLKYDESLLREQGLQWQAQLLTQCSGDIFVASDAVLNDKGWAEVALDASLQVISLRAQVRERESQTQELTNEKQRMQAEITSLERDLLRIDNLLQRERAKMGRYEQQLATLRDASKPASQREAQATPHSRQVAGYNWRPLSIWDSWRPTGRTNEAFPTLGQHTPPPPPPPPKSEPKPDREPTPDVDMVALELQLAFNEENEQLEAQMRELQRIQPKFFDCKICFEQHQEDNVAIVHPCEHAYCRACLLSYAASKIEEHRYPILCPMCTADPQGNAPGEIDDEAIRQLGLTEHQYVVFVEMQMLRYSILMHCRKCTQSVFVDKEEYQATNIIHCPLAGCGYIWCKQCSHAVDLSVGEHSCDGTKELNHIMKQHGWKHCPGCQTPAEKISGCNHMSCMAPGCNTHFCYLCGQLIVRSALGSEINNAKQNHYTRCTLF
ncbi:hypothetical protein C8Q70DRAFT_501362 [Cubamyces menziesii]|uniref:RBR-type E3 ubiquitin transferase n=1 Tax=Trametes cubensis TaxID=1111947 RepID=A0AAD7TTT9_9APHY|nr:hypothetical protein C8Q70DRAFT_501362 [Cubamyces menziesii]KAJ8482217.1 hypothetical protein ONZ51_g5481 [Trametes cubensis]